MWKCFHYLSDVQTIMDLPSSIFLTTSWSSLRSPSMRCSLAWNDRKNENETATCVYVRACVCVCVCVCVNVCVCVCVCACVCVLNGGDVNREVACGIWYATKRIVDQALVSTLKLPNLRLHEEVLVLYIMRGARLALMQYEQTDRPTDRQAHTYCNRRNFHPRWGLCPYIIVYAILPPSPVILWIELGGKPKRLPLKFGYHDVMHTAPVLCIFRTLGRAYEINRIRKISTYTSVCDTVLAVRKFITYKNARVWNFYGSKWRVCKFLWLHYLQSAKKRSYATTWPRLGKQCCNVCDLRCVFKDASHLALLCFWA